MSTRNDTLRATYLHPDDPANHIGPNDEFVVDGLDWAWAFVYYKPVPDFPGYCVGSNGTAWSSLRYAAWRQLKPIPDQTGHLRLALRAGGATFPIALHHLILEAFVGKRPGGMVGCHFDDDPANNRPSNLRWDTSSGNVSDAMRNGRIKRGETHGMAKLSEAQIIAIREEFATGSVSHVDLTRRYGITKSAIHAIASGRLWSHVGGTITRTRTRKPKLDESIADRIRTLIAGGMSKAEAAKQFGILKSTVTRITKSI